MENKEELQSLINELRGQLPSNTTIELIGDDDLARETQSQPGQALPAELIEEISQATAALAREIFGDDAVVEVEPPMEISPIDGSEESREAMRAMIKRLMPKRQCYHYILDSAGQPRHVEKRWEVEAFLRRKGHMLAEKRFGYRGYTLEVTTQFVVHNPMIGNVPPSPRWVTAAHMPGIDGPDDNAPHWFSYTAEEAMATHRKVCASTQRFLMAEHRERRPSPTRRVAALKRIAAGRDVLRRRGSR